MDRGRVVHRIVGRIGGRAPAHCHRAAQVPPEAPKVTLLTGRLPRRVQHVPTETVLAKLYKGDEYWKYKNAFEWDAYRPQQ